MTNEQIVDAYVPQGRWVDDEPEDIPAPPTPHAGVGTRSVNDNVKEITMTSAQLEVLATAFLGGEIDTMDEIHVLCAADARSRRTIRPLDTIRYFAPITEKEAGWKESGEGGVEVAMYGATVYDPAPAGHIALEGHEQIASFDVDPAKQEDWGTRYVTEAHTIAPNETAQLEDRKYDRVAWLATRWPVVAFEPGDVENGYLADLTNLKSESNLEREYAKPYTRTVTDYVRPTKLDSKGREVTDFGFVHIQADGSKQERVEDVLTMGSVEWEYKRRAQGRQPWMSKHSYKHTMDHARAREREVETWPKIKALIQTLGADPAAPEVGAWVKKVGFEVALTKLTRRAAQIEMSHQASLAL